MLLTTSHKQKSVRKYSSIPHRGRSAALIFILLFTFIPQSFSTSLSSCNVIGSSGDYILTTNLSSSSYCFNITASKVTLDCNYHSISSTYTAIIIKSPYIKVRNCYIKDSLEGVLSLDDYNTIQNIHGENITTNVVTVKYGNENTVKNVYANNSQIGISLTNTQKTNVDNVLCYNTTWYCTYVMNSLNNYISNIYSYNSTKYSAYLKDSINITLNGGEMKMAELAGVMIQNTNESRIQSLTITNTSKGVYISDASSYNNITANYIQNNTYGIYIIESANNTVFNNVLINYINAYADASNNWNISKKCRIRNLVRGWCIGGNFWGNYSKTGVSDTCSDSDGNGLCDTSTYSFQTYTDYLPMSRYINLNLHSSPSRVDKKYTTSLNIYGKAILMPYFSLLTSHDVDIYVNGKYKDTKTTTSLATYSDTLSIPSGAYMEVKVNTTYLTIYSYDIINITIAPYDIYLYFYAPSSDILPYDKKGFGIIQQDNNIVVVSSSPTFPSSMIKTSSYLRVGIPSTNNLIIAYTRSLSPYRIYERIKELKDAAYKEICNFNIGYALMKECYAFITLDYSSKAFKISSNIINLLAGDYRIKIRKTMANTIEISR